MCADSRKVTVVILVFPPVARTLWFLNSSDQQPKHSGFYSRHTSSWNTLAFIVFGSVARNMVNLWTSSQNTLVLKISGSKNTPTLQSSEQKPEQSCSYNLPTNPANTASYSLQTSSQNTLVLLVFRQVASTLCLLQSSDQQPENSVLIFFRPVGSALWLLQSLDQQSAHSGYYSPRTVASTFWLLQSSDQQPVHTGYYSPRTVASTLWLLQSSDQQPGHSGSYCPRISSENIVVLIVFRPVARTLQL